MSDRAAPPGPGPIRPYEFPQVVEERLGNGMSVLVARKQPFGLVTGMVVLRAGETSVPVGREGLAVLSGDALEGGTTRLSSTGLARRLEDIGASFGAATGWDSTTVAVSSLADNLHDAMPLLAEMVRSPAFAPLEFDRYRAQRMATAAQRRMDPASLAADYHVRCVYGEGDTYARPPGGTEESLGDIEAGHAREYAAAHYGPAHAAVVVVGDVDSDEVVRLADRRFGDWGEQVAAPREAVVAEREPSRSIHVVHRPGSVQSEIRVGHVGVSRFIEDYPALTVVNLVLGGSFSSRLNLNLREEHGFTYGVRSTFAARRNRGPFVVSTAVGNEVTAAAVREIFREIEALQESGPSTDEVESAKSYLAGVFPLRMQTTGQLASRIAGLIVFGLPVDYYRDYRDNIRKVTRGQAAEAARRYIRPQELCTVVVGDADSIAPALEDLGIGQVTVHDERG